MDCIFCKIVNKEISAKIIAETSKSIAFMDAFPLTLGHSLVIPKIHYEKIQDISIEDNADLFETVRKTIAKIDKITNATLVAIHNGKESGQEIPHVHVHLIPRSPKDSAGPVHSMFRNMAKLSDKETNQIYEKLKE
ncbi:MAG TPA: HIT domain-containing protein [Nitrosopumilaceae archaeon]|nr:HIT domain-containing protein [Nitrosopumilaceae archaeon]